MEDKESLHITSPVDDKCSADIPSVEDENPSVEDEEESPTDEDSTEEGTCGSEYSPTPKYPSKVKMSTISLPTLFSCLNQTSLLSCKRKFSTSVCQKYWARR